MSDPKRAEDDASKLAKSLKAGMLLVARGHKVTVGEGPADYQKNAKGGIANEVGAFAYALSDLDTWYSILMSSLIAYVLNRNNYFLKPQGSTFIREFFVFTLFELIQPKLSSVIPRFGVEDIDTHRYRAGVTEGDIASRRLAYAAYETEIGAKWDWAVMFAEWGNALPVVLVCMVIVDVGLGKRSDLTSLLHYMFVMLLVSGTRFFKNGILVNNPGRQSGAEIFRRAMALGHSYETVPKIKYSGKVPPRTYTYTAEAGYGQEVEKPK